MTDNNARDEFVSLYGLNPDDSDNSEALDLDEVAAEESPVIVEVEEDRWGVAYDVSIYTPTYGNASLRLTGEELRALTDYLSEHRGDFV